MRNQTMKKQEKKDERQSERLWNGEERQKLVRNGTYREDSMKMVSSQFEGSRNEQIVKKTGIIIMFTFLLGFLFISPADVSAAYRGEVLAQMSWGSGQSELGILVQADGHYGPQSFLLSNSNSLYILDSVNNKLKEYDLFNGKMISELDIAAYSRDITQDFNGNTIILSHDRLSTYSKSGELVSVRNLPSEFPFISGLVTDADKLAYLELSRGDSLDLRVLKYSKEAVKSLKTGIASRGSFYQVEKIDSIFARVHHFDSTGVFSKR